MRILILSNNSGGLFCFRGALIRQLNYLGHEIYAATSFDDNIRELSKITKELIETPIDRRGMDPIRDAKLLANYFNLISRVKPDKVITYTIKPNIYGCFVCCIKKIDAYANVTGLGTAFQGDGLLTKIVTFMHKIAFKRVKKVFFENKENRDIIVSKGIINKERTHCLKGAGVDLEEYRIAEYPKNGTIKFLFIGRIMKEKGIDELFEATKRLKNEGADITVDVVGRFEDHYETVVNELDKAGIIKYHGYQSDVKPFIRQAHCFVLPSYHEGMANTLLECGAMGRPLITSNIHGCLEAVKDGETGFLCNAKDTDDLYGKMKRFFELPYERKKDMGRLSHEFVAGVFDKKKVVEETVKEIMG